MEETWWGRGEKYEEEQVRLKRQLEGAEEEHRILSALLLITDGRTSAFKYLKSRHRKIGDQIWAIRNIDLSAQQEFRS